MMDNKKEHLKNRIEARQANESTAAQFGYQEMIELSDEAEAVLKRVPVCPECKGQKKVKGLFYFYDCASCFATGIDLSKPLAVIRLQQEFLNTAKAVIVEQRRTLYMNSTTAEERLADDIEDCYKDSKFNRFD